MVSSVKKSATSKSKVKSASKVKSTKSNSVMKSPKTYTFKGFTVTITDLSESQYRRLQAVDPKTIVKMNYILTDNANAAMRLNTKYYDVLEIILNNPKFSRKVRSQVLQRHYKTIQFPEDEYDVDSDIDDYEEGYDNGANLKEIVKRFLKNDYIKTSSRN